MPVIRKQNAKKTKHRVKTGSVLDRVEPLSTEKDFSFCFYGRSGTGKTTLWATFPKPILVMLCSGSMRPGELKSIDTKENRKTIKKVTLQHSDEIYDLIEDQEKTMKYKTIVLDHITGLQDMILAEVLELEDFSVQKYWGMATQTNWGTVGTRLKRCVGKLLALSCYRGIMAQEREFIPKEEESSDLVLMPHVSAALTPRTTRDFLEPACDFLYQTFKRPLIKRKTVGVGKKKVVISEETDEVEYCLRTRPHAIYATKFRIPKGTKLPAVIVDPTYQKIKALIEQED